jgi:trans-aconitate 2-methyltransferase
VSQGRYLFGDNETAAQRLKLLARVYQESTRAFLAKAGGSARFQLALDLGCGPGFTTHLIADTLKCDRVIGLDASAGFIELARANSGKRLSFLQHDITAIPFPSEPANLIFARFLLAHLRDAAAVVAKWATQLQARGLLLLEETEAIHTTHPVFARYLTIVEAMLAGHSKQLYAGRLLASLDLQGELNPMMNQLSSVPVRNSDAARMFVLNLRTWKESEFVRTNYSPGFILELENDLAEIAAIESPAREIEWEMRQTAWLKK